MTKARGGSTRRWRERVRAPVLLRDVGKGCRAHREGWCDLAGKTTTHECQEGRPDVVWHAHHTLGYAVTGDDPRYLVAACAACNGYIGEPAKGNPQPKRVSRW